MLYHVTYIHPVLSTPPQNCKIGLPKLQNWATKTTKLGYQTRIIGWPQLCAWIATNGKIGNWANSDPCAATWHMFLAILLTSEIDENTFWQKLEKSRRRLSIEHKNIEFWPIYNVLYMYYHLLVRSNVIPQSCHAVKSWGGDK